MKNYTDLAPAEIRSICVVTNSRGPFEEDVFFLIDGGDQRWVLPMAEQEGFMDWLKIVKVDYECFIEAMTCTENRIFLIYQTGRPIFNEETETSLKERLNSFLRIHFEAPLSELDAIASGILASYREEHRHYHNLRHIQHVLWELDRIKGDFDRDLLELAFWYHDVVYDAASFKEQRSGARLHFELGFLKSKLNVKKAEDLILLKPREARSEEEKIFVDIDFSVLGAPELEYLAYAQNVRREYASVPDFIFFPRRRKFLRNLLKGKIFHSERFQALYEEQARKNLQAELARLPFKWMPAF